MSNSNIKPQGVNTENYKVRIFADRYELGQAAGTDAGKLIREAIKEKGQANIILATGTSQFQTLETLIADKNIEWDKVVMFHLDEYVGLPITSPASFRKYLQERVLFRLPPLKAAYLISGEGDVLKECDRLGMLITENPIDVALVGIGENGHLAFNDPPADFDTVKPYLVVRLDEACRNQQFSEGWFESVNDVPTRAISMSIRQILKSRHIICSVPDERKALAVKNSLEEPVSNLYPASILRQHQDCGFYLDRFSSALLKRNDEQ